MCSDFRLVLEGITKHYGDTVANDGIDLAVERGVIHALLGENGAGKSTLAKIVYGSVPPDSGRILWQGEPVSITDPAAARRLGISMVFQHFNLFDSLTVEENLVLGMDHPPDRRELTERLDALTERYAAPLDPDRRVFTLSAGERQRLEILRCLLQEPELLIMDEPTGVLAPPEAEALFATLRRLASEGRSILYISHKIAEIRDLCTVATVLRDGRIAAVCNPSEESPEALAVAMIGHRIQEVSGRTTNKQATAPVLEVRGLSMPSDGFTGTALSEIDLIVRGGEVVGIGGVAGSGQRELAMALSGERRTTSDEAIVVEGFACGRRGPAHRRQRGLAFVPEDRLGRGAIAEMDLARNALLTSHGEELVARGLIRWREVRDLATRIVEEFGIRARGSTAAAGSLSGGNLQKFILGRELKQDPRALVLSYPTWGLDVGAAARIRQAIVDLREEGVGVLVFSESLDELLEICDRISIISEGRLSPMRDRAEATVEELGLWITGQGMSAPEASGNAA